MYFPPFSDTSPSFVTEQELRRSSNSSLSITSWVFKASFVDWPKRVKVQTLSSVSLAVLYIVSPSLISSFLMEETEKEYFTPLCRPEKIISHSSVLYSSPFILTKYPSASFISFQLSLMVLSPWLTALATGGKSGYVHTIS